MTKTWVGIALCVLLLAAPAAAEPNYLFNPGFIDWTGNLPTNWQLAGEGSLVSVVPNMAGAGGFKVVTVTRQAGSGNQFNAHLAQDLAQMPGLSPAWWANRRVTGCVWMSFTKTDPRLVAHVSIAGAGTHPEQHSVLTHIGDGSWQYLCVTTTFTGDITQAIFNACDLEVPDGVTALAGEVHCTTPTFYPGLP